MSEQQYNFIYSKLVSSEDDIEGMIAYSIYKRHKIEFITNYKEQHEGNAPSDKDMESFFISSTTDSQLEKYKERAGSLLSETVVSMAGDQIDHYEDEMLRDYEKHIKKCLPSSGKTILLNMVATLLFSLILGIGYFIVSTSEKKTKDNTEQFMNAIKPAQSGTENDSTTIK